MASLAPHSSSAFMPLDALADIAPGVKAGWHVAIPSRLVIFERMRLPSRDAAELSGMVRLQFEKSLPHPMQEMSCGWQMLHEQGAETELMAFAVHEPELAALFAPLGEPPLQLCLAPWALHVAALAAEDETACGLWREDEDVVFGIFEGRRLGFVGAIREPFTDLPRALISAALAGASTHLGRMFVDPALAAYAERLGALVGVPVAEWRAPGLGLVPGEAVNLVPDEWRARAVARGRTQRLRWRIAVAAAVYAALIAVAAIALGLGQRRLAALDREIAALHPRVDGFIEMQARWNAMAPAVEPERFLVELLRQTCQAFPTLETRLTRFELATQGQLVIEGEAANARQAIAFAEALKACPAFKGWRFESGPPVLLSNEHAQFRIFGKP